MFIDRIIVSSVVGNQERPSSSIAVIVPSEVTRKINRNLTLITIYICPEMILG